MQAADDGEDGGISQSMIIGLSVGFGSLVGIVVCCCFVFKCFDCKTDNKCDRKTAWKWLDLWNLTKMGIIKIDEDGVYKHTMLHALQNVHLILTPTTINVIYLKLFYGEFCLISGKSFRRKRAEKCKKG